MTLPVKIISGIALTGIGGTGLLLTRRYISPNNIEEQLKWDGYKILSTVSETSSTNEDDGEWKNIVKNWNTNTELSRFASESSTKTSENEQIAALKEKCKSTMKITKDSQNFQDSLIKAQKYCVNQKENKQ